jgi:hypothetical protein
MQVEPESHGAVSLPKHLVELEAIAQEHRVVALVLDPMISRLSANLDTHKDGDVRRALEPLAAWADRTGVAVLGLIHVNKSASTDPLTTIMGSRAFAAVARAVLFAMVDPENETRRLLGQPKNNLGRVDLPTLAFSIIGVKVADTAEGEVWTGRLQWDAEDNRSIRECVEAAALVSGDRTATSEAGDWLIDYLESQGGRADAADIKREGARAGHSKDSLHRAKKRLRLGSVSSGFPRRAFWFIATHTATTTTTKNIATTANNATNESVGAVGAVGAVVGNGHDAR